MTIWVLVAESKYLLVFHTFLSFVQHALGSLIHFISLSHTQSSYLFFTLVLIQSLPVEAAIYLLF